MPLIHFAVSSEPETTKYLLHKELKDIFKQRAQLMQQYDLLGARVETINAMLRDIQQRKEQQNGQAD